MDSKNKINQIIRVILLVKKVQLKYIKDSLLLLKMKIFKNQLMLEKEKTS